MEPLKGIVYKITNLVNGKSYIGQTTLKLSKRIAGHRNSKKATMYKVFKKYGEENLKKEILCCSLNIEYLDWLEEFLIASHNTLQPEGYNLHSGGSSRRGFKLSEETKIRISKRLIGNKYNLGKKRTKEQRQEQSRRLKGRKFSKQHRDKIAEANRKRVLTEEQKEHLRRINTGKKRSFEAIEKTRIANTGKKRTKETKIKISQAHMGKQKHTKESKEKLSNINKGNTIWLGRKHSEESKLKISKANKGRKMSPFTEEHRRKMSEAKKGKSTRGINYLLKKSQEKVKECTPLH